MCVCVSVSFITLFFEHNKILTFSSPTQLHKSERLNDSSFLVNPVNTNRHLTVISTGNVGRERFC